ncbi:C-terminal binding protein [Chitinivorax sp. B]|uniref:C-terminal binding protein n=1 Tax=Chitinivorax sp. B TaxID=2502235 RepID=UPI0010FA0453|nr:C-terminal binding protein [Chitinivorax sp. B]
MIIGITDRITSLGPIEQEFEENGMTFRFFNSLNEYDFNEQDLAEVDALLVWHAKLTDCTASRLRKCRIVVRYGVGYDQVDGDALARRGIPFANNPSYCTEEVADSAVAMILSMTRNIGRHDALARSYGKTWQENSLRSLRSRACKVGLVGIGRIGAATALRLRALGFQVMAYDPVVPAGTEKVLGVQRVSQLDELLSACDVVSLHCPLTPETTGLIDQRFLAAMRSDGILVNTARGKILRSLDDLYEHMQANPYFRASLDVLPQEPPSDHPLIAAWRERAPWLHERLVINPHNAYHSDAAYVDMRRDALGTVWLALQHQRLQNIVNGVKAG